MGPPDKQPAFPVLDTYDLPGYRLTARAPTVWECNWLQVKENSMDPAHLAFLHTLPGSEGFTDDFKELGEWDWMETPIGMVYIDTRRQDERVWVRGADFILPAVRDEVRYAARLELMWDNSIDTLTFRNFANEQALPIRRIGAFLPGEGVGGSGIHWGALHWRFLPSDFRIRSALTERYGANALPEGMTIQDWPMSYDEMEPFYDKFEKLCGISGQAGNLRGTKIAGGNVFEGPRSNN